MKIDPDDPRLTAYALDELDEEERAAIEESLKESDEARREIDEIRVATGLLTEELKKEECPELSVEQRDAVTELLKHEPSKKIIPFPLTKRFVWISLSAAAAIVVLLVTVATERRATQAYRYASVNNLKQLQPEEGEVQSARPMENYSQKGKTGTLLPQKPDGGNGAEQLPALNNSYQTRLQGADSGPTPDGKDVPPATPEWQSGNLSYGYGAYGLKESTSPQKSDGGNVLSADGHVQFQKSFVPPLSQSPDQSGQLGGRKPLTEPPPLTLKPGQPETPYAVNAIKAYDQFNAGPMRRDIGTPSDSEEVLGSGRSGKSSDWAGSINYGSPGAPPPAQVPAPASPSPAPLRRDLGVPTVGDIPLMGRLFPGSGGSDEIRRGQEEEEPYTSRTPATSPGTESYERRGDNPFLAANQNPLSTFSIDVDTASYANIRRFLSQGQLPPRDAVRIEEMINYFPYNYAPPRGDDPFAVYLEVGPCPWNGENRLARVGIKGKEIGSFERPRCNLVFLIDVSGSMQPDNKLPLVKRALEMLVEQMHEADHIAIVTYASSAQVELRPTSGANKRRILDTIARLTANGSTNGGAGIQLAYELAMENFRGGGVNRVILCTDGDFNVGVTNQGDLTSLIEDKAKSRVFLSVLGFGMGNLKDSTMEKLADKGNGNYAYIDNLAEAQKVLVEEMTGTLVTIAKDVKVQIEFNPGLVRAYRLIGYENRLLRKEDFHNDRKDAGEIGAGHTVTALYEIVPAYARQPRTGVDSLRYQKPTPPTNPPSSEELLTLKLRYKAPNADRIKLMEFPVRDRDVRITETSDDFRFAAAVAEFGMILRGSPYKGGITFDGVIELADASRGYDPNGYRGEFVELVRQARALR